jgi:hemerythrin-like domain-containing protein
MTTLRDLLTTDHRQCDDRLAAAEQACAANDLAGAKAAFAGFRDAMLRHFASEEATLFPAFEARTGMSQGPTAVMRMEHAQMRGLLDAALAALAAGESDDYLGQAETLVIMMQQHNMKEENILYPMCDQHLEAELPAVLERLETEIRSE